MDTVSKYRQIIELSELSHLPLKDLISGMTQSLQGFFETNLVIAIVVNPLLSTPIAISDADIVIDPETLLQLSTEAGDGLTIDGASHLWHSSFARLGRIVYIMPIKTRRGTFCGLIALPYSQEVSDLVAQSDLMTLFKSALVAVLRTAWLRYRYDQIMDFSQDISQSIVTVDKLSERLSKCIPMIIDVSYAWTLALYVTPRRKLRSYIWERGELKIDEGDLEGYSKRVMETGETLFVSDYDTQLKELNLPPLVSYPDTDPAPSQSFIVSPLKLNERVIGVLSIQSLEKFRFDEDDEHLLELLGNHIELAIRNNDLFENLHSIQKVGEQLNHQAELSDPFLQRLTKAITQYTGADLVMLYAPQGNVIRHFQGGSLLNSSLPVIPADEENSVTRAIQLKDPLFAANAFDSYEALGFMGNYQGSFIHREQISSSAVLPLRVGRRRVGALFLNYRNKQDFDEAQRLPINILASYAAIALHNQMKTKQLEDMSHLEQDLRRMVDLTIVKELDVDITLQRVLDAARDRAPADEAAILLIDKTTDVLLPHVVFGPFGDARNQVRLEAGKPSYVRQAFDTKKAVRVHNIQPGQKGYFTVSPDTRSELDVPILIDNTAIGVINLESTEPQAYSDNIVAFMEALAGQASIAIKNARLLNRWQRFNTLQQEIASGNYNRPELFERILGDAITLITDDEGRGQIFMYDENRTSSDNMQRQLIEVNQIGLNGRQVKTTWPLDKGEVGRFTREILTLINTNDESALSFHRNITDVSKSPYFVNDLGFANGSELLIPLISQTRHGNHFIGLINIETAIPDYFTENHIELLRSLATTAVIAYQNAEHLYRAKLVSQLRTIDEAIIKQKADPEAAFETVLKAACDLFGADKGDFYRYNYDSWTVHCMTKMREEAEIMVVSHTIYDEIMPPIIRDGIIDHVARTRHPYRMFDYANDPYLFQPDGLEMRSEIAVPLLDEQNDKLIGVLNLECFGEHCFTELDLDTLQTFAGQATIAYLHARDTKRADRHRLLIQIEDGLRNAKTEDEAYDVTLNTIYEVYSAYEVEIVLRWYNPATGVLEIKRMLGDPLNAPRLLYGEGITGEAIMQNKAQVVSDIRYLTPKNIAILAPDSKINSVLAVPIVLSEKSSGAITLGSPITGTFTEIDTEILTALVSQLILTLHRIYTAPQLEAAGRTQGLATVGITAISIAHKTGNVITPVVQFLQKIETSLMEIHPPDQQTSDIYANLQTVQLKLEDYLDIVQGISQKLDQMSDLFHTGQTIPTEIRDAYQLMEQSRANVLRTHGSSGITINLPPRGDQPIYIRVVPDQIINALDEIITNGVQFLGARGHGTIDLKVEISNQHARFTIRDDGPGIDATPDKINDIFTLRFTKRKGGSGIGLFSARWYISANGGNITVYNEVPKTKDTPGCCAVFTIDLPLADIAIAGDSANEARPS